MRRNQVIPALLALSSMGLTSSCSYTDAPETKGVNQICIDEAILPLLDSILLGTDTGFCMHGQQHQVC